MKNYTALTGNMLKHLAKGDSVQYNSALVLRTDGNRLIVRGKINNKEMELHYRLDKGKDYGFSKEQIKSILASRAKPIFTVTLK